MMKIDITIDTDQTVDRRMSYIGRVQYGQNYRGRSPYDQNYRRNFRRGNVRGMQSYRGQNFRGGYRGNLRNDNFGRGRSRPRERLILVILEGMSKVVVGLDQVQEGLLIEKGLDVLNVGSMIILQKTLHMYQILRKNNQSRYSKCLIWKKIKQLQ